MAHGKGLSENEKVGASSQPNSRSKEPPKRPPHPGAKVHTDLTLRPSMFGQLAGDGDPVCL